MLTKFYGLQKQFENIFDNFRELKAKKKEECKNSDDLSGKKKNESTKKKKKIKNEGKILCNKLC